MRSFPLRNWSKSRETSLRKEKYLRRFGVQAEMAQRDQGKRLAHNMKSS